MWKQANQCTGAWLAHSLSIVRIVTLSDAQTNTHIWKAANNFAVTGECCSLLQTETRIVRILRSSPAPGMNKKVSLHSPNTWGKNIELNTCVLMSTLSLVFGSWLLLCCGRASLTEWKQGAPRRSCSPAAENSSLIVSLPRCSSLPVSYIIPKWQAHGVILGDPPNCRSQYDSLQRHKW